MSKTKTQQSLNNLENALSRLEEAVNIENPDQLYIDGTIQRFEFVFELFWKTLKRLLELEGIQATTPKSALKEAYQIGWIKNESAWLQMLRDSILTSQVYDEDMAKRIYQDIIKYYPELKQVFNHVKLKLN